MCRMFACRPSELAEEEYAECMLLYHLVTLADAERQRKMLGG